MNYSPHRGTYNAKTVRDRAGDMIFTPIPAGLSQIKSGGMKAIAVSTLQRGSALPDVPTLNEAGLPGCDAASWYDLF